MRVNTQLLKYSRYRLDVKTKKLRIDETRCYEKEKIEKKFHLPPKT